MAKSKKQNLEITGRVMFTPDPEKALFEFKDGDYGYNVPIEVSGAKPSDRFRICLCYDSRVLADGVFANPETGDWVTDKARALKRGDVIRVKASDYNKPKKPQKDQDGKPLHYHNYWVSSERQVEILSTEANRPRPKATKKTSSRPRG